MKNAIEIATILTARVAALPDSKIKSNRNRKLRDIAHRFMLNGGAEVHSIDWILTMYGDLMPKSWQSIKDRRQMFVWAVAKKPGSQRIDIVPIKEVI